MEKSLSLKRQYRKIFTIKMPLCLAEIYLPTHCFGTAGLIGRGIENIVYKIEGGELVGYFSEEDIAEVGQQGVQYLKNKKFFKKVKKDSFQAARKLSDSSVYLESINLANLDSSQLLSFYREQITLIRRVYSYFNLSSPAISYALERSLDERLSQVGYSQAKIRAIKEQFLREALPTTIEEEDIEIKKLAYQIQRQSQLKKLFQKKDTKAIVIALANQFIDFNDLLTIHTEKYKFLQGYVDFSVFDKEYYLYRLKELVFKPVQKLPDEIKRYGRFSAGKKIKNKFKIKDKKTLFLLELSQYFTYHRMQMRIHFTQGLVAYKKILDEMARRINISQEDIKYLLIKEVVQWLRDARKINSRIIHQREKICIYYIQDKKGPDLLVGREAHQFKKKYLTRRISLETEFLKGRMANPGKQQGVVKVILDTKNLVQEIAEMKPGAILVTVNTRPDMILACRKAAAIVTEEGGILSHAALISRELGLPCIVGACEATKILQNGDLVEVDADRAAVKIIKKGAQTLNTMKT